jgi:hypothetical protein
VRRHRLWEEKSYLLRRTIDNSLNFRPCQFLSLELEYTSVVHLPRPVPSALPLPIPVTVAVFFRPIGAQPFRYLPSQHADPDHGSGRKHEGVVDLIAALPPVATVRGEVFTVVRDEVVVAKRSCKEGTRMDRLFGTSAIKCTFLQKYVTK